MPKPKSSSSSSAQADPYKNMREVGKQILKDAKAEGKRGK